MFENLDSLVYAERHQKLEREANQFRLAKEANWEPGFARFYHRVQAAASRLTGANQPARQVITLKQPHSIDKPTKHAA